MLWRRPDGELVRDLPLTRRVMPYVMRGRNEAAVYFEQQVDLRHTDAFIREFNVAHPATPVNLQHIVMWGTMQAMVRYPTMNRFVAGGRIYQRHDIWYSYSAKRTLKEGSPVIVVKRRFDPEEPFADAVADMARQLREDRFGGRSGTDAEIGLIMKLPGVLRRVVFAAGRFLDAFGLFPRWFIDNDPLYGSAFFAFLGSLGMDALYHHLYEYGTIGVFCAIGRPTTVPGSPTSGPDRRRSLVLRWTFDDRCEDGLVAGYALKRAKQVIEDPFAAGMWPAGAEAHDRASAAGSP